MHVGGGGGRLLLLVFSSFDNMGQMEEASLCKWSLNQHVDSCDAE